MLMQRREDLVSALNSIVQSLDILHMVNSLDILHVISRLLFYLKFGESSEAKFKCCF